MTCTMGENFHKLYNMLPGTLQSSNTNSQVLDPRIPSLSSLGLVVKPSIP